MKNKNTKKILSAIAVLAVSATMALTTVPFAGCSESNELPLKQETSAIKGGNVTTIETAVGPAQSVSSGVTYWAAPGVDLQSGSGTFEEPYNVARLLTDIDLQPGDTVLLKPGLYSMSTRIIFAKSGSYNSYITIRVANSNDNAAITDGVATLDFSQLEFSGTNRGVQINGNFVYWYGIDICGAGDNGMYIGGNFNTIEYSEFYNNRDTGLQLGRSSADYSSIDNWPSYNLIKNCTSHNNYDNETYGENADGFAAKLTIGYGNVFDGCVAYRNSDDGWDLYAYPENGNIGTVIMYNCVAFENGYLETTRDEYNSLFPTFLAKAGSFVDVSANPFMTRDGDGNGFKLGGAVMEGDVIMYNCLSFQNRMHGVTDNSNPGYIKLQGITSYDNSAVIGTDGKVISGSNAESHGNINVARQTYSYNAVNNVLSVTSGMPLTLEADDYRGTVSNSLLNAKTKTNVVSGSIEADTNNAGGKTYTSQVTSLVAADVFKTLPVIYDSQAGTYTYNINGAYNGLDVANFGNASYSMSGTTINYKVAATSPDRVHITYRNADGSINMGDLLDKSEGGETIISGYLGTGVTAGSTLNKTSWADYTHFYEEDFVDDSGTNDEAVVARTLEALVINCDDNAVYQDFEVPTAMWGTTISWTSSDNNLLVVGTDVSTSISNTKFITLTVYRPEDVDAQVTLTATVSYGSSKDTKAFNLTIKQGDPSLGKISVVTQDDVVVDDGGSVIVDQYAKYYEPEVQVLNGLYPDSEKYLDESVYEVSTKYEYATNKNAVLREVNDFTPSKAGVYVITNTVTLGGNGAYKGTTTKMSYNIYVASKAAQVDFENNYSTVNVYRDGYTISGNLTSATGTIYAVSSATELTDITAENIKEYDGVESYDFRANSISFNFTNANDSSYYVYYALSNVNGEITSEGDDGNGIYCVQITALDIETTAQFTTLAQNGKLGNEIASQTVYLLKNDLDFKTVTFNSGTGSFAGVFNGNGYTISNLSTTSQGIFYKVTGGTIMNLKLVNFTVTEAASSDKVGFVIESTGGYFYNIAFTNASLTGNKGRVAALIGHVGGSSDGLTKVYDLSISQVSVTNDADHKITASTRASGLIGYVQYYGCAITIDNCAVVTDLDVSGGSEAGGMIASWEDGKSTDTLTITNCYYLGTISTSASSTRGGGMLGYHKGGAGTLYIDSCLSLATFVCGKVTLTASLKNCSPIIGNYSTAATVTVRNCFSLMEEYNTDYNVLVYTLDQIATPAIFGAGNLNWDLETKWTLIYEADSTTTLAVPYISLNYLS